MTMKHKMIYPIIIATVFSVTLISCVKDNLHDTPYPDKGTVEISTDWSDALSENDIPAVYFISVDGGEAVETKEKAFFHTEPMSPGKHNILAYNKPDAIGIDGTTARVDILEPGIINAMPGYLFSAMKQPEVIQDGNVQVLMPMKRHVCPVKLKLTLTGNNAKNIERIDAVLSGIIASVDLQTGATGDDNMSVIMNKCGHTATEVKMQCRVLGVTTGYPQLLTVSITMRDGHKEQTTSDLSVKLKTINTDMRPVELRADMDAPQNGVFGWIISDWIPMGNIDIDADMQ